MPFFQTLRNRNADARSGMVGTPGEVLSITQYFSVPGAAFLFCVSAVASNPPFVHVKAIPQVIKYLHYLYELNVPGLIDFGVGQASGVTKMVTLPTGRCSLLLA
jgi:hypothetical protein